MMPSEFKVSVLHDDARCVATQSVLDNSNADTFAQLIMDIYAKGARHVVIDMSSLQFLSSAGIGAIISTVELFRERDGDIILAHVSEKIMGILKVLDLHDYLAVSQSLDEATNLCRK